MPDVAPANDQGLLNTASAILSSSTFWHNGKILTTKQLDWDLKVLSHHQQYLTPPSGSACTDAAIHLVSFITLFFL